MSLGKETRSRAIFYGILLAVTAFSFAGPANPTCSVSCAYRSEMALDITFWGSIVASAGTGLFVLLYWLYTLKEKASLRPLLRWPRTIWFSLPLAVFPLVGFWLHYGTFGWTMLGLFLVFDLYAYQNQWVDGHPASIATSTTSEAGISTSSKLVVTEDGRAVSLSELERFKVIQVGGNPTLAFVHCTLSRSLNVFAIEDNALIRATLPHDTGFYLRCDRNKIHWDGVDGSPLGDHQRLASIGFRLGTACEEKEAKVFRVKPNLPPKASALCTPYLPSAQAVSNPMDWGVIKSGEWHHNAVTAEGDSFFLARWAAHKRGLNIPLELI